MKLRLRSEFYEALLIYRLICYIAFLAESITFSTYICFLLYHTARKSILSQLFRQTAGYVNLIK